MEQPAGAAVRRVLLHVVPNPGKPASAAQDAPNPQRPMSLATTLGVTLAAPLVQSWTADLTESQRQSRTAARRAEGVTGIQQVLQSIDAPGDRLLEPLCHVRMGWVVDDFVSALDAQLGRYATAGRGPATGIHVSSSVIDQIRAGCLKRAEQHWAQGTLHFSFDRAEPDDSRVSTENQLARQLAHLGPDLFNTTLGTVLRWIRENEAQASDDHGTPSKEDWATAAKSLHDSRRAGQAPVRWERDLLRRFLQDQLGTATGSSVADADGLRQWAGGVFDAWLTEAFPKPTDLAGTRPTEPRTCVTLGGICSPGSRATPRT